MNLQSSIRNKWLEIGITPPHIVERHNKTSAALKAALETARKHEDKRRLKEGKVPFEPVVMCKALAKQYPDGFTFLDLVAAYGKPTRYWAHYFFDVKKINKEVIYVVEFIPSGNKNGKMAKYKVQESQLANLEATFLAKQLNGIKNLSHLKGV